MNALPLSNALAKTERNIVVERPRASDAIGTALRDAFDRDGGIPADMMRLLVQLNGVAHR